jgi:hypothetical protein
MDSKVTLDVRSILIAGLVLLGLVLAYLVGSADDDPATTAVAAEETPEKQRSLMMVGAGEVSVVPDQLAFSLAVNVKRPDVSTAFDDSSRVMDRVLDALKPYGVEKADMQSTGLSIDPDYQYFNYQPPQIVGYRVSQRARITVTELKQAGEAISAAVHAGGNAVRVSGIALQVSDREAAMEEARKDAVAEARAKAQQYADETGQELGDVLSLSEVRATGGRDRGYYSPYNLRAALTDGLKALPIRAGEEELTVRVRVVWAFA